MNITEYIKNKGKIVVQNPNYNPKSKKNKEPQFIEIPNLEPTTGFFSEGAQKEAEERIYVPEKEVDKYGKHGIQWNQYEANNGSLDKQLADAQGAFTKFGNGLAQALVSEIGLGTLKGFSDLIDWVAQGISVSDKDYTNPISAKLQEWQDKFNNEVAPIYTTPGVDISNGGLTDMGWWASNMPSIMSSLTLLLPSVAATKGISLIGKALKATRAGKAATNITKNVASWTSRATKLNQSKLAKTWNTTKAIETRKMMAESAMSGTLSRVMENYQEARQTYTDMYKEASNSLSQMSDEEYADFLQKNKETIGQDVDTNDRDEVAKAVARKSADETFKLDFANTAFDIWQIYALRNIPFKGFRSQPNRASVNVANKNSIRYAGMSVEEKAAAVAARSKFNKARETSWNYIKGSANAIGAQASEGVEEAVNYIAQQEGMNLGHVMLGMEDQSDFWDDRLEKYANAPELWESAFWGLMGGVVFQGLGSGFNRARGAIEASIENRKKQYGKEDGKSGEKIEKPTWKELWQAPEVKRRIAEIEERDADFRSYIEKIKAIDDGKNPFETDENDISASIDPHSKEAELLKDKAYNDMVTKMTLRALDTGNYDMLKEFLTSDEVKKALIDKGVMTAEDAARTQTDVAKTMDHIVQMYDENLEALNAMSSNINRQRANGLDGETIPVEYLQIIARENINNQLSLEETQRQIEAWELTKQQKEEFARRGGALDSAVPYQDTVKLRNLTNALGNLLAQKKALEKNKGELETITGQQKLERINSTIDIVKNMVLEINPDQKRAYLLFALQNAAAYEQTTIPGGRGPQTVTNINFGSEDYLAFRQRVVDMDKQILAEYGDEFKDFTEAEFGQVAVIEDNFRRADVVLKEAKETLKETPNAPENAISKDLVDAYNAIADLQIGEQLLRKQLVVNEQQLRNRVNDMHNFMNEARVEAVNKARENLMTLADKYGVESIRQALREAYDNRNKPNQSNILSESDLRLFNDSLDYLRLDKDANANLFGFIDEALQVHADIQAAQRLKNAALQNQSSDTENGESNNLSSQQGESNTSQENSTNGNSNRQSLPQPLSNEEGEYLSYRYNANNEIEAVVNLDNKQGRKIVEANNESSSDNEGYWYSTEPGVSIIDNNYIIGENPIVELDENGNVVKVVRPGRLVLATPENEQVVAEQEAQVEQQPAPASTPSSTSTAQRVETSTPSPATVSPDEAVAASAIPSSTGEVLDDVAPIPDVTPKEEVENEVRKEILKYLQDAIAKKTSINWNVIRDHLKNNHKGKLASEAELNDIIKRGIRTYKQLADRRNIPQVADVVDTVIKASSITETSSPALKQDFDKYVDRLVAKYAKQVAADYIDGQYYISLTDLLRYCNKVCDTTEAANMLYYALYDSLKRNKEKYVITELSFEDFVANSKVDNRQRTQRLLNINGTYGINHDGLLRQMIEHKSPDVGRFYRILDSLKEGDTITYEVDKEHIDFKVNGFRIGYLPIPKPRADGATTQVNDELITDILENHDGSISSDLQNLLISWLDNDAINKILCKAAFTNLSTTERNKLSEELLGLQEVKDAIEAGRIKRNPDQLKLLEGLAKIWRFSKQYVGESPEDTRDRRAEAIEDWFKYMVAPSFNMVFALEASQQGTVTVKSISEGELIRRDGKEPLPISQAIGSRHKGQVRIAISKTEGELTVAGQGVSTDGVNRETTVPFRGIAGGVSRSRTILVIPSRDGNHGYVHMFPRPIRTMLEAGRRLAPGVAPLVSALQDEIQSITERYQTPEEQCNALESYFRTLFDARSNANTPLLWGVNVKDFEDQATHTKLGFALLYYDSKGNRHTIRVSHRHNPSGTVVNRPSIRLSVDNTHYDKIEDVIKYLKQAITVGQFNIGISFIDSDNDTKVDTRNPLVYRDDQGNFVITANGREFKYKSFNDFIIDNDLVSVNTEPSSDGRSNYNHLATGLNQAATQSLKVSITAPVQNAPTVETEQEGITTTADKVLHILNDHNQENKGKAIAEAILGNKATNLRVGRELGSLLPKNVKINNTILSLFPNNIIFVDRYIGDNAFTNAGTKPQVDKTTGITVQPGQVVVGREFMDMINGNMADKRQAIRKLIHEQLHLIINNEKFINPKTNRNRYIEQIESIFNKFKDAVGENDPVFSKYLFSEDEYQTDGKINDVGLEEFLVETLTSEELARKLNEIPSDETFEDSNKKKSLFQVIMEKLAKMFNWPIKKGSLYYEELQALRDVLSVEETEQSNEVQPSTPTSSTGVQMEIPFDEINEKADTDANNDAPEPQASSPVEGHDVLPQVPETTETPTEPVAAEPANEESFEDNRDRNLRDRTRRTSRKLRRSSRTETTPDYTEEMNQIKAEAIANGTFMKAPNGKPTKLNERQWLQVRTKAFKDWFGDWERVANFAHSNAYEELEKYASDSGMHSRLIRFLMDNFNPNIRALVSRLGSGLYNPLYKELHIPLYQYGIEDGPAAMRGNKKVVLHELVHSITTSLLYSYYNIKQPGYEQTLREQGYKDELPKLSKEQVEAFDKIREIQKKVSKYIEEHEKEVEDIQRKYDVHFDYQTFISYYRGTENDEAGYLDEFISEAFSNPALQEVMSKIASEEETKKTIFDTFLEALGRLFNFKGTLLHDFFSAAQDAFDSSYNDVSKVVDENGEPLVVYHHTDNPDLKEFSIDFDNYFTKDGGTKKAVFFDENKTGTLNRKYDIPVFLNIRDLRTYNGTKEDLHKAGTTYRAVVNESAEANDVTGGLHMHDFDDNKLEHQDIWIAHNPNQIKSATDNNGEFSTTDNNIRRSSRTEAPSVAAMVDRAPLDEQSSIINNINNGNISISCR